jgi:F0F1-type ATP synthase assembly protein I
MPAVCRPSSVAALSTATLLPIISSLLLCKEVNFCGIVPQLVIATFVGGVDVVYIFPGCVTLCKVCYFFMPSFPLGVAIGPSPWGLGEKSKLIFTQLLVIYESPCL